MEEEMKQGSEPKTPAGSSTEATSKKTLKDIEETQKDSGPTAGDSELPDPDGAFDSPGDESDAGQI